MSLASSLRGGAARLVGMLRRGERERRLDDEIAFHVDMLVERNVRAGMGPEEARRVAMLAFGGRERHRESARDEYRSPAIETLARDVRHAARALRRAPIFSLAVILSIGLGIGATTVIFSVADHVILRPLPYEDPQRLVVVRLVVQEVSDQYPTLPANAMHVDEWRRSCTVCDGVAALHPAAVTWTSAGDPERLAAVQVSPGFFGVLGVRPQLGRFFSEEDARPGAPGTVVISDAFWRGRFGADSSAVGRTVMLDRIPHRISGILPASFRLPKGDELGELVQLASSVDIYLPLRLEQWQLESGGAFDYAAIARLSSGMTLAQARAEFGAMEARLAERHPLTIQPVLTPLREQVVGGERRALLLLLGAVFLVFAIVCVNVALLLLARAASRKREAAVRVALGAGRVGLLRRALIESLGLALIGGLLGFLLAYIGLEALLATAPPDLPRLRDVQLDGRIALVAFLLSALAGIGFGAAPAARLAAAEPSDVLKAGGRNSIGARGRARGRAALVAVQVGLSTVLLVVAGLFLVSYVHVLGVDKGFDGRRVVAFDVALPLEGFETREQRVQFHDRALAGLAAIPGVVATGLANRLPLEGEAEVDILWREYDSRPDLGSPQRLRSNLAKRPIANRRFVSPRYFETLAIPIVHGRAFHDGDRGQQVVVLSERAADALWPGEDPIGRRVIAGSNAPPSEVVGVVADVPTMSLEDSASLVAYLPHWQRGEFSSTMLLRTNAEPEGLAAAVRATMREVAPTVPLARMRTLEQMLSDATARRRFHVVLLVLFGLTALCTASVGIYGVIAHSLAERTAEIGVRLALGAQPRDVRRMVLREGLTPVGAGILAGIAMSVLAGRAFGNLLFEVRPSDPATLAGVATLLAAVAALACWVPARSSTRLDPVTALRTEG